MTALAHEPPRRPAPTLPGRTWRMAGTVTLAHAGLLWLAASQVLSTSPPASEPEHVIMASVLMDLPAPAAPTPQPVTPKAQPKPQVQPTPLVTAQPQPSPVPTPTMSASPPTPAAAPAAAGNPRPATSNTAAVVLPSSDADYLNNPPPAYPRMSRRMGEQGTVVLRVFINTEGRAEQAEVRTSSGYSRLDEAALETVRRWRYVPGKRAGVAEAMWFNVPIRFVLD